MIPDIDTMDLIIYGVVVLYSLGILTVLRGNVRRYYASYREQWNTLDWSDIFVGFIAGLIRSALWPITTISGRVTADDFGRIVAGEDDKAKAKRLETQNKKNGKRLLELELNSGIISRAEYNQSIKELL